jgi:tRNA pseudouridine55 synthase
VDAIEYLRDEGDGVHVLRIRRGKGVYIRTLCSDIGRALGCGGHMQSLERVAAGIFDIESALTPRQVDALAAEGRLSQALLPLDAPLFHLPEVRVGARCRHAVLNGNPLRAAWLDGPAPQGQAVRVYLEDEFAGIGVPQPNGDAKFRAMLYRAGGNG